MSTSNEEKAAAKEELEREEQQAIEPTPSTSGADKQTEDKAVDATGQKPSETEEQPPKEEAQEEGNEEVQSDGKLPLGTVRNRRVRLQTLRLVTVFAISDQEAHARADHLPVQGSRGHSLQPGLLHATCQACGRRGLGGTFFHQRRTHRDERLVIKMGSLPPRMSGHCAHEGGKNATITSCSLPRMSVSVTTTNYCNFFTLDTAQAAGRTWRIPPDQPSRGVRPSDPLSSAATRRWSVTL